MNSKFVSLIVHSARNVPLTVSTDSVRMDEAETPASPVSRLSARVRKHLERKGGAA